MTKTKKWQILGLVVLLGLLGFGIYKSQTRLTYMEYTSLNAATDASIPLTNSGETLTQEFYSPYTILHGVDLQIGTFGQDNNSFWNISISEVDTGNVLYAERFNASLIKDNGYRLFEFKKNIKVSTDKKYAATITAENVSEATALAFYRSSKAANPDLALSYSGTPLPGTLCFDVYGGNTDYWWTGYTILIGVFFILLFLRICYLVNAKKKLRDDRLLTSMILAGIVFALLAAFSVADAFSDETDNMFGGMIIAKGGVLYRDYVTQHTPVAYYLCGAFALLGAGSIEQFRLSYYVLQAIIWALVYFRHAPYFGKKKLLVLPLAEVIFISSALNPYGSLVLSEGIEGICLVILLLEFLRYYKDRKLGWGRSIIVSLCMWGSVGAAFVSAYALVWVVLAVAVLEIIDWVKNGISLKKFFSRYYKLLICGVVPLILAVLYFTLNNCLRLAFNQFYTFNVDVYSHYAGGLGTNMAQPFIETFINYFNLYAKNVVAILTGAATNEAVMQLLIAIVVTSITVLLLIKRKFFQAITIFLVFCGAASRGYGFHGMAAWYVAILIIVLFMETFSQCFSRIKKPVLVLVLIYMVSTYCVTVGRALLTKQSSVSELQSEVVAMTTDGEKVFMDEWSGCSLYLLYKNRYPVNTALCMLPWYMDWFEQDSTTQLIENKPNVVVYNTDLEIWGYTNFANNFVSVLKQNYSRLSDNPDDGWKYSVWVKN